VLESAATPIQFSVIELPSEATARAVRARREIEQVAGQDGLVRDDRHARRSAVRRGLRHAVDRHGRRDRRQGASERDRRRGCGARDVEVDLAAARCVGGIDGGSQGAGIGRARRYSRILRGVDDERPGGVRGAGTEEGRDEESRSQGRTSAQLDPGRRRHSPSPLSEHRSQGL
jgi:hypothetical protein